jgi:predicted nucleic acid-binding protein
MSISASVINASPFIILSKAGLIDLLPDLFNEVLMPHGVVDEISVRNDEAARNIERFRGSWLTLLDVQPNLQIAVWNLGNGETEVLSYAFEEGRTAMVDDRAARRCAETLRIKTLGTAGLMVLAKRRRLIESVSVELQKLESAGLYLSDAVKTVTLTEAGE